MTVCNRCGKENQDHYKFCLGCGAELTAAPKPGGDMAMMKTMMADQGSSGVGSAPYLAGLLFQKLAGVKLHHRPYPDTRKLYEDLQSGRLDLSFNNAATMLPLVRDKQLRALAVTTPQRCAALPDVPTIAEAALEGYALNNWLGFVAPPGTPMPAVMRLNRALIGALHSPGSLSFLTANGIDIAASTPAEFAAHIAAEMKRWAWLREN